MKLGLGTVQLGLPYGIANKHGQPAEDAAVAIIKTAYDKGITFLDTSSAYGSSEKIIGRFVSEHEAELNICSKFISLKTAENELEKALKNMHVDKIGYYLLHGAGEVFEKGAEFTDTLQRLKKSGAVVKTGVSVYNSSDIQECLKYEGVEVLQLPFNIMDSRLLQSGMLQELKKRGVEIHARSIYLQGLLLIPAGELPEYLKAASPYLQKLDALCENIGLSKAALAFCYVRDCPLIDKMLVGCESMEQVLENIALYSLPPLTAERISELEKSFLNIEEKILNPALWKESRA